MEYDGRTWAVSTEQRLELLDATAEGVQVAWSVGDLRRVRAIATSAQSDRITAVVEDGGLEVFEWAMPGPTLRNRIPVSNDRVSATATVAASPHGQVLLSEPAGEATRVRRGNTLTPWPGATAIEHVASAITSEAWFSKADARRLELHSYTRNDLALRFDHGPGASPVGRLGSRFLTVCDRFGRLVVVELLTGELVTDLRL